MSEETAGISGAPGSESQNELIRWNSELMATGVGQVDEEHRQLIAKINELHRIRLAGATAQDIKPILHFLDHYARDHFRHEETVMKEVQCPLREQNCIAHLEFLREYRELVEAFNLNQDADETAGAIERMAGRWLLSHICRVDVSLRDCHTPEPGK